MIETKGINLYAEYSLHDALKRYYAGSGGRLEVDIDGRIADAVRADGEIIEVQTKGLWAIQAKVASWADAGRRVRVVRPITVLRRIERRSEAGELLSSRKSPKKEDFWDLFEELVRTPLLIGRDEISLEFISIAATEERRVLSCPVRRGRHLRDYKTVDRRLDELYSSRVLSGRQSWLDLLPQDPPPPWTSASLGSALDIGTRRARLVLYTLCRAALIATGPAPESAGFEGSSPSGSVPSGSVPSMGARGKGSSTEASAPDGRRLGRGRRLYYYPVEV